MAKQRTLRDLLNEYFDIRSTGTYDRAFYTKDSEEWGEKLRDLDDSAWNLYGVSLNATYNSAYHTATTDIRELLSKFGQLLRDGNDEWNEVRNPLLEQFGINVDALVADVDTYLKEFN